MMAAAIFLRHLSDEAQRVDDEAREWVYSMSRPNRGWAQEDLRKAYLQCVASIVMKRMRQELEPYHRYAVRLIACRMRPVYPAVPSEIQDVMDGISAQWAGVYQELATP